MALARVSRVPTKVLHTKEELIEFAGVGSGIEIPPGWFQDADAGEPILEALRQRKSHTKSIPTRTGIVVTLERRPTVDRAWVVCAMSDETMTDMEVVEGGEDREKALANMVKKHGGAK